MQCNLLAGWLSAPAMIVAATDCYLAMHTSETWTPRVTSTSVVHAIYMESFKSIFIEIYWLTLRGHMHAAEQQSPHTTLYCTYFKIRVNELHFALFLLHMQGFCSSVAVIADFLPNIFFCSPTANTFFHSGIEFNSNLKWIWCNNYSFFFPSIPVHTPQSQYQCCIIVKLK